MGHAVLVHHRRNEVQKERNRQRKVFKVMIQLNKMSRTNVKNLHLIANKKKEPQDWLQLNEDDEGSIPAFKNYRKWRVSSS